MMSVHGGGKTSRRCGTRSGGFGCRSAVAAAVPGGGAAAGIGSGVGRAVGRARHGVRTSNRDGHSSMLGFCAGTRLSEQGCRQRTPIGRLTSSTHRSANRCSRRGFRSQCGVDRPGVRQPSLRQSVGRRPRRAPARGQADGGPRFCTAARTVAVAARSRHPSEHADRHERRNAHLSQAGDGGAMGCESGRRWDTARNREVFDRFLEAKFEPIGRQRSRFTERRRHRA